MSKKKVLITAVVTIFLIVAALSIFPGCKNTGTAEVAGESEAEKTPVKVVDGDENIVELAGPALSIVVLAPSALEIIDALGAMELVVEVDSWSVEQHDPLAEGFEGAGDAFGPNIEKIAELNPDILITPTGGPEDDFLKISDLGIEIYRVINVKGIEGVYDEIINISKIVGFGDKGEELVNELKGEVDAIYSQVKDLNDDDKPEVFYEVWNDPLTSTGGDTYISDLIEKAGGINIVAEDNLTGWPEYSVERLIEKNPDIIIAPVSLASDPSVITGDERFASIDAVINGRVYIIPDNSISRPNQNLIKKALPMLAKAIHPEIFGEFEIIE
ncbi:MAG TPA: helical backbone metal receptor [Candidatus Humimicrobiaceae bacterium]